MLHHTPFPQKVAFFLSLLSVIQRGGKTHTALAAVIRSEWVRCVGEGEREGRGTGRGVRVIYLEGVSLLVRWLGYSGKKFVKQGPQKQGWVTSSHNLKLKLHLPDKCNSFWHLKSTNLFFISFKLLLGSQDTLGKKYSLPSFPHRKSSKQLEGFIS